MPQKYFTGQNLEPTNRSLVNTVQADDNPQAYEQARNYIDTNPASKKHCTAVQLKVET